MLLLFETFFFNIFFLPERVLEYLALVKTRTKKEFLLAATVWMGKITAPLVVLAKQMDSYMVQK